MPLTCETGSAALEARQAAQALNLRWMGMSTSSDSSFQNQSWATMIKDTSSVCSALEAIPRCSTCSLELQGPGCRERPGGRYPDTKQAIDGLDWVSGTLESRERPVANRIRPAEFLSWGGR